jgi:CheY-like chemotaxis protein
MKRKYKDTTSPPVTRNNSSFRRLYLSSIRFATSTLSLLGCLCSCLAADNSQPPAAEADTFTSEYEKAPHPSFVTRENVSQWAQAEQDRYRLRVKLPDGIDQNEDSLHDEAIARRARHRGSVQPEDSQTLVWVAVFTFAGVLSISRLRPDFREKHIHPWQLLPPTLRQKLQQACGPQDASPAEGRRLVKAMEHGAGAGFLQPEPQQLDVLEGIINALQETHDRNKRQELLLRAYLLTHALTPISEPRRARAAWQIRHSLEALLKKLLSQSIPPTSTALVAATKAVDVLKELLAAGPQGEAAFEWPVRILAVYDNPVTCQAMEVVLQSVFEHPLFATDGESAMALAGERAFDVIFIDVGLQGIDGYAVCRMLRQIAIHHYTPVVLVTNRTDDAAWADAAASGANDLISRPLLSVEVTLQALVLALRYRMAGGGATPRNAAQACTSWLMAEGRMPRDSGIVCGTTDTEILRVVTRN